jgi:hypothetical protein
VTKITCMYTALNAWPWLMFAVHIGTVAYKDLLQINDNVDRLRATPRTSNRFTGLRNGVVKRRFGHIKEAPYRTSNMKLSVLYFYSLQSELI